MTLTPAAWQVVTMLWVFLMSIDIERGLHCDLLGELVAVSSLRLKCIGNGLIICPPLGSYERISIGCSILVMTIALQQLTSDMLCWRADWMSKVSAQVLDIQEEEANPEHSHTLQDQ